MAKIRSYNTTACNGVGDKEKVLEENKKDTFTSHKKEKVEISMVHLDLENLMLTWQIEIKKERKQRINYQASLCKWMRYG